VIPHVEGIIGNEIQRIIADKGYRGHGAPVFRQSRRLVSAVGGPRRARAPDERGISFCLHDANVELRAQRLSAGAVRLLS
jgi:hypothetical protein